MSTITPWWCGRPMAKEVQEFEEDRAFTSGITGFHRVVVHILA